MRLTVHVADAEAMNRSDAEIGSVVGASVCETPPVAGGAIDGGEAIADRFGPLDDLPVPASVIDHDGVICAVNAAWSRFGNENGRVGPCVDVGFAYRAFLDCDDAAAAAAANGVFETIQGRTEEYTHIYPCHSPTEQRWYQFLVVPLGDTHPREVLAVHAPIAAPLDLAGMANAAILAVDGFTTICAWCQHRLRVDGAWEPLSDLAQDVRLTHGICPTCLSTILP